MRDAFDDNFGVEDSELFRAEILSQLIKIYEV